MPMVIDLDHFYFFGWYPLFFRFGYPKIYYAFKMLDLKLPRAYMAELCCDVVIKVNIFLFASSFEHFRADTDRIWV